MEGNGNELGTAAKKQTKKTKQKKKMSFLLPDYAFINCGLISPIFGHFFSMLNADTVASAGINGRKMVMSQEQQKKNASLRSDYAFINFESISPIFHDFLSNFKILNADKVASAGIHGKKW